MSRSDDTPMEGKLIGGVGGVGDVGVCRLALGTWQIGDSGIYQYGDVSDEMARSIVHAYLERGGDVIDTAHRYGERSERTVGEVVNEAGMRKRVAIVSKTFGGRSENDIDVIEAELETSLNRLGTDYVDALLLHLPPENARARDKALGALQRLKESGLILAAGASLRGPNVTDDTVRICHEYLDTGMVDVIEVVYSVLRQKLAGVIRRAADLGVRVLLRSVLESGLLTGKYPIGHRFGGIDHRTRYRRENLEFVLAAAADLAESILPPGYATFAQVATRFALSAEGVTSVIVGASSTEQVIRNMRVLDLPPLPEEYVDQLRKRFETESERSNFE